MTTSNVATSQKYELMQRMCASLKIGSSHILMNEHKYAMMPLITKSLYRRGVYFTVLLLKFREIFYRIHAIYLLLEYKNYVTSEIARVYLNVTDPDGYEIYRKRSKTSGKYLCFF